jgi:hypothetical protein
LCLPTAPVLPLERREISVRPRFMGNSRTSHRLPLSLTLGDEISNAIEIEK